MNPVRWKYLAVVFLALSVLFLSLVTILPFIKSPQHAVYNGPAYRSPVGAGTISGYYIPPVDSGSKVSVSIDDFIPGDVDILVFPSKVGEISPSAPAFYVKTPQINTTEFFFANGTQPYGIYVYSRNNSLFTVLVSATYSPYYWLSGYAAVGVMAVLASVVLLYYYNFTAKRWRYEQAEIREARGEGKSSQVGG